MKHVTVAAAVAVAVLFAVSPTTQAKGPIDCDAFAGNILKLGAEGKYNALLPSLAQAARKLNEAVKAGKVKPDEAGIYFRGIAHGYCFAVLDLTREEAKPAPAPRAPGMRSI